MNEYGNKIDESSVRFERLLPGPIERVWAYLTESDKRRTWLAAGELEPKAGGKMELHFRNSELASIPEKVPEKYKNCDDVLSSARVLQYEAPRLFRFLWEDEGMGPTEVTFELTPKGSQVQLVLTHRKLASRKDLLGVSGGWHVHLDVLEARLKDEPSGRFWSKLERLEEEYDKLV